MLADTLGCIGIAELPALILEPGVVVVLDICRRRDAVSQNAFGWGGL